MFARFLGQLLRRAAAEAPVKVESPRDAANLILEGQQAENEGRLEYAVDCYQAGLAALPDSAELNTKLGNVLRDLGRDAEAIVAYREAVALNPGFAAAHNNLGVALCAQDEVEEATLSFRQAIAIDPALAAAHENLGGILFGQGRLADSLASFRQVIKTQPDNGNALHMIAAMTGDNPERAPHQYVAKVFDGYAGKFEAHLLQGLHYDIPRELVALIGEYASAKPEKWDVLDLGCGTGLIGVEIAARARHLVGVDLSRKMLERAREKNCYTRLEDSDLQTMMESEPAASYDAIIAADVFIYVGKLDDIVTQAKRLLRPGGLFAFSLEAIDVPGSAQTAADGMPGYRLTLTGRYAHASAYVERLAARNGFVSRRLLRSSIRQEHGVPVPGWLVLWENPR